MTPDKSVFQKWFDSLSTKDAALHDELKRKLDNLVLARRQSGFESAELDETELRSSALETLVRDGRPAIPILDHRISFNGAIVDEASKTVVDRLKRAAPVVESCIPLVGRIDVGNYPGSLTYVGTGWMVDTNVVVTNRHVAELIAQNDTGTFSFRPGRFGEDLRVTFDNRHELGLEATAAVPVAGVIWIERDSQGPDVAFLELEQKTDGTKRQSIPLAKSDAAANTEVAVIGYPARAPEDIIPNQAWMDRVYENAYDVKRIAPGLMGVDSRGWSTHDCTTLGGNSGSVVIDMSGQAVALHFAGLYMIENYAVPASTIQRYLSDRPWQGNSSSRRSDVETRVNRGETSITIPLTITVSLGKPEIASATAQILLNTSGNDSSQLRSQDIHEAARELYRAHKVEGVYSVWAGYEIEDGRLTDNDCLVVSTHPDRIAVVRSAMPQIFQGYPVDVRPASIDEMMGSAGFLEAVVGSINYNDDGRTSDDYSFDWVDEEMTVQLHVGPERSWQVLSKFLKDTTDELISSMYEFHAAHIADAIQQQLQNGTSLTLVLARQSRDPNNNQISTGDFDRSETFERWKQSFNNKFNRIFVPLGTNGLVAMSYHIKVTVADNSKIWLSSGNW
ncbi:MAG TPA: trypsin-like peptidase domain-containing protein, partial [Pyrinomonadaceae bacterium]